MLKNPWINAARCASEGGEGAALWMECYRFWALPSLSLHADWSQKLWGDLIKAGAGCERVHRMVSQLIAEFYGLDLAEALPLSTPPSRLVALLDGALSVRLIEFAGLALLRPRLMGQLDTRSLRPAIAGLEKESLHFVVHEAQLVFKGGGTGEPAVANSWVLDLGCIHLAGASLLRFILSDLGEQGLQRLELKLPKGIFTEWEPPQGLSLDAAWEVVRRIVRLKFTHETGPSAPVIRAILGGVVLGE
jgi:hypothetical protein